MIRPPPLPAALRAGLQSAAILLSTAWCCWCIAAPETIPVYRTWLANGARARTLARLEAYREEAIRREEFWRTWERAVARGEPAARETLLRADAAIPPEEIDIRLLHRILVEGTD